MVSRNTDPGAARYIEFSSQNPPLPLMAARHWSHVAKPQFRAPASSLYCAHHGYVISARTEDAPDRLAATLAAAKAATVKIVRMESLPSSRPPATKPRVEWPLPIPAWMVWPASEKRIPKGK